MRVSAFVDFMNIEVVISNTSKKAKGRRFSGDLSGLLNINNSDKYLKFGCVKDKLYTKIGDETMEVFNIVCFKNILWIRGTKQYIIAINDYCDETDNISGLTVPVSSDYDAVKVLKNKEYVRELEINYLDVVTPNTFFILMGDRGYDLKKLIMDKCYELKEDETGIARPMKKTDIKDTTNEIMLDLKNEWIIKGTVATDDKIVTIIKDLKDNKYKLLSNNKVVYESNATSISFAFNLIMEWNEHQQVINQIDVRYL